MGKEQVYLAAPLCFTFWLFWAYFYFDLPRITIRGPLLPAAPPFQRSRISSFTDQVIGESATKITSIPSTKDTQEVTYSAEPIMEFESKSDSCDGRYIYIHDLPRKFNEGIIKDCENLIKFTNMCRHLENNGFGQKLDNAEGTFSSSSGWYDTHQFTLDVIFHHRMMRYDCLTRNSSLSAAVYVPFYGGFDVAKNLEWGKDIQVRDALSNELVNWLKNTPEWKIIGGQDHFVVPGRITWEFRRVTDNAKDFGNKLLLLPEVENMTTINVESSPWDSNDIAIPYPTYFHPSKDAEVSFWQHRIQNLKREWLFTFAGGPRPYDQRSIRNPVFDQCKNSDACKLYQCAHEGNICSPEGVIQLFQNSVFCLQPPGDSPTRRSTFDGILAGCIPVFFHPSAAYVQYIWHLPKEYTKYSVFIWEGDIRKKNVSIEETLRQISPQRIEKMREAVIDLIPRIIYADPSSKLRTFKDAFDVAVDAVIQKVAKLKRISISADAMQPEQVESHDWDSYVNV